MADFLKATKTKSKMQVTFKGRFHSIIPSQVYLPI